MLRKYALIMMVLGWWFLGETRGAAFSNSEYFFYGPFQSLAVCEQVAAGFYHRKIGPCFESAIPPRIIKP